MPTSLPTRPTEKIQSRDVQSFGIYLGKDRFRYVVLFGLAVAMLGWITISSHHPVDPSSRINVTVTDQF